MNGSPSSPKAPCTFIYDFSNIHIFHTFPLITLIPALLSSKASNNSPYTYTIPSDLPSRISPFVLLTIHLLILLSDHPLSICWWARLCFFLDGADRTFYILNQVQSFVDFMNGADGIFLIFLSIYSSTFQPLHSP